MSERITAKQYRQRMGLADSPPNGGDKKPKAQIRIPKKRDPNKVEAEWMRICETRHPKCIQILYEPISFNLPSGTRYTPDVLVVDGSLEGSFITCYEVKGPHLHGNSANSIRAFKEAKATYWWVNFSFAQHTKDGWAVA